MPDNTSRQEDRTVVQPTMRNQPSFDDHESDIIVHATPSSLDNNNNNNNNNSNHTAIQTAAIVESSVNTGQDNCSTDSKKQKRRQVGGAAVAGGIVGLVLVGPVVGLVAAGGAAVVATTKGTPGQMARATGTVTAAAGGRLKRLDKKYKVTKTTSKGFVKGCNWVSTRLTSPVKDDNNNKPTVQNA
jgi:hypothetical protein